MNDPLGPRRCVAFVNVSAGLSVVRTRNTRKHSSSGRRTVKSVWISCSAFLRASYDIIKTRDGSAAAGRGIRHAYFSKKKRNSRPERTRRVTIALFVGNVIMIRAFDDGWVFVPKVNI